MEAAVRCLRPHNAGGHTLFCAEHFKTWLCEAYPQERENPSSKTWKVDTDCGNIALHVEHRGYPSRVVVDHPGLDIQVKHRHLGDWPPVYDIEVHGGNIQYPPPGQHPVPQCLPQFIRRERHRRRPWSSISPKILPASTNTPYYLYFSTRGSPRIG